MEECENILKPIPAHYRWETRGRIQPRGFRIVPVELDRGLFYNAHWQIQAQESRHFGYIGVVPVLWPGMRLRMIIWGINLLSGISIGLFYQNLQQRFPLRRIGKKLKILQRISIDGRGGGVTGPIWWANSTISCGKIWSSGFPTRVHILGMSTSCSISFSESSSEDDNAYSDSLSDTSSILVQRNDVNRIWRYRWLWRHIYDVSMTYLFIFPPNRRSIFDGFILLRCVLCYYKKCMLHAWTLNQLNTIETVNVKNLE